MAKRKRTKDYIDKVFLSCTIIDLSKKNEKNENQQEKNDVKKHNIKDMKPSVLDKTGFCFSMSTQRSTNAFMIT